MPLLEVENVSRKFGGLVALDNVAFKVTPGQIKSIIGPNGAGKTTLLNVISGLLASDTGRITFKGRKINGLKSHQIALAGMSRTFQNPSLFLQMSVLENVMVGRHPRTRSGFAACCLRLPGQIREEKAIRETAMEHIRYVGLEALAHAPAGALGFGERRMVELARALATEPALLLLDEPASGLNNRETEDLGECIRRISEKGITVLLVEHDMSLVMAISDNILVLHNGAPLAEGTPSVIQNNDEVIRVYLGTGFEHAAPSRKP
jgi:branched-chain amino acid transport system ATP-binding protein